MRPRGKRRGRLCGCSAGAVQVVVPRRRGGGGHGAVPAEHELHAVRCGALLAPCLLLPCRELSLPALFPLPALLCLLSLCLSGALLDRGDGRERERLAGLELGLRLLRASRARGWEGWVHGGGGLGGGEAWRVMATPGGVRCGGVAPCSRACRQRRVESIASTMCPAWRPASFRAARSRQWRPWASCACATTPARA